MSDSNGASNGRNGGSQGQSRDNRPGGRERDGRNGGRDRDRDSRSQGGQGGQVRVARPGEARPGDSRNGDSRQQDPRNDRGDRGGRNDCGGRNDRGDRNARADRGDRATVVRPAEPLVPPPECPLCHKPITDIASALAEKTSKEPVHFDCVMAQIVEAERLEKDERVAYLGSGIFAVIEGGLAGQPGQPGTSRLQVKRKIQYEEKAERPEWRQKIDRSAIK